MQAFAFATANFREYLSVAAFAGMDLLPLAAVHGMVFGAAAIVASRSSGTKY
jgi:hypothetical protein